ncbi:MAG: hypothetical protein WD295_00415, partial [Bacteroidota bacterium]
MKLPSRSGNGQSSSTRSIPGPDTVLCAAIPGGLGLISIFSRMMTCGYSEVCRSTKEEMKSRMGLHRRTKIRIARPRN